MAETGGWARDIDMSVPNLARIYDYWLGGKDNFRADRAAAVESAAAIPQLPLLARENRAFLRRAVRFCVSAGVTQFLDIGSGLPTAENTHEVAQRAAPEARTVYVDIDPVVVSHARALLATPLTRAVRGDLTQPGAVLSAAEGTGLLDFARPVAVLLGAVLHHVPDEAGPAGAVAAFRDAMAPGSCMVVSHAQLAPGHVAGREPLSDLGRDLIDSWRGAQKGNGTRDRDEIAAFFGDLPLVEPGLTEVWAWQPDPGAAMVHPGALTILGGVAKKD